MIGADHPEAAAGEVIGDGGFVVDPAVEALADALDRALAGEQPAGPPTERAAQFHWSSVTDRAESVYERVADA